MKRQAKVFYAVVISLSCIIISFIIVSFLGFITVYYETNKTAELAIEGINIVNASNEYTNVKTDLFFEDQLT